MPKRTMTVARVWYHTFRKTKEVGNVAELPDGRDLLDVFETFARREVAPERLVRNRNETYARVVDVVRKGRSVTVVFESGRFGEEGKLKHVRTHEEVGSYTKDHATAVTTHGVLLVPKNGTSALAFSERSAGQGGMTTMLDAFVEKFDGTYNDFRMKKTVVVQKDAWLERAQLMKVKATVRKYRADPASDEVDVVLGTLAHSLVPEGKQKYFPPEIWQGLTHHRINRAKFLGFPDGTEIDTVDVTVGDGDQEKTFEVGDEKTPTLRLVITNSGEAALKLDKLRERVLDEAGDIFAYYGVEWDRSHVQ